MTLDDIKHHRAFGETAVYLDWDIPSFRRMRNLIITEIHQRAPIMRDYTINIDFYEPTRITSKYEASMLAVVYWSDGFYGIHVPDLTQRIAGSLH